MQEQQQLNRDTEELSNQQGVLGAKEKDLTPEQKAQIARLTQGQQKLADRADQLLKKMDAVAEERKAKDPDTAEELRHAAEEARKDDVPGLMQQARDELHQNQLKSAGADQQKALAQLEKLVKNLEDRRDAELDRLARKLREEEKKLAELYDDQEKLQKKTRELKQQLQKATDLGERRRLEDELKKLAREQERLQKDVEERVKQLSRLRAERASQALAKAGEPLQQAGDQLRQGRDAEQQQDDALDRLDEAQRELERKRQEAEDELAREQLAKVQDQLKALLERQERATKDREDLERKVQQKTAWTRDTLSRLLDLAEAQKNLAAEAALVADTKLDDAVVFAQVLRKAADAMKQASEKIGERKKAVAVNPSDTAADEETARLQKQAEGWLKQLLDALKPEPPAARQPKDENNGGQGEQGGQGGQGGTQGGNKDGIPYLAQLKLIRGLQVDVSKRTEEFGRRFPDLDKLDEKGQAELKSLRRDQQEVADLLEELTGKQ